MKKHHSKPIEAPIGHAVFLYDTTDKRNELLATYLKEGLEHNELCIVVMPETAQQVLKTLRKNGLDAEAAVERGNLRIFDTYETYMQDGGKFVAQYMLHNVEGFIEDAKAQGYKGLRTAGEMSWIFDHPEVIPEAISYEKSVNSLFLKGNNFTGICLYPSQQTFTTMLSGVLCAHPEYITGMQRSVNPYFGRV